jgi:hypothetical protein
MWITGQMADSDFSFLPTNGFTLVVLASAYAIGRWSGGLLVLVLQPLMPWLVRRGALPAALTIREIRADAEWFLGTLTGMFYLTFWLSGYLSGS